VEQHTFSALIMLDPPARHDLVLRYLDGTRTYAILQSCHGMYFPASICCFGWQSSQRVLHATVHIPLLPGEGDALFIGGQIFTVWADAIVSDISVRGTGLLGDGVMVGREPASDQDVAQTATHRRPSYRRAIPPPRTGLARQPWQDNRDPKLAPTR
jgi:hypothetical protein